MQVANADGDIFEASPQGEGYWLISWPCGDLRFHGTKSQVIRKLKCLANQAPSLGLCQYQNPRSDPHATLSVDPQNQ